MRRLAGLAGAAALGLAGCDGSPAAPDGTAGGSTETVQAAPAAVPDATRQIGSVSGLTGEASTLKGLVSGFQVRQTATATVVLLASDTLFAFDSATISPEAAGNLRRTADLVRRGGAGSVKVIGHTDGKGDDAYNDGLSRRRAQAVADWLSGPGGLSDRALAVEGRGKREPVAPDTKPDGSDDPGGRARNRRVEVIIPRA